MHPLTALRRRVDRDLNAFRANVAIGKLMAREANRLGILQSGDRTFLDRVYVVVWWTVALATAFLPTYPQEPFFVFPALLALGTSWVLAAPQVGRAIRQGDYSGLRPGPGLLATVVTAIQKEGVSLTTPTPADTEEAERLLPGLIPKVVPAALLRLFYGRAVTAAATGILGFLGLLVGIPLSRVHFLWLGGWSPVSILYAVAAPGVLFLLLTLLVPIVVDLYTIHRELDQQEPGPTPPPEP